MGVTKFFDDRIGIVIPIKGGTGVRIWNKIELNKAVVFRFAKLAPGGQVVPDTDGDLISIHTPAWGATEIVTYTIRVTNTFQFTPPRGGRLFARDPDAMLDIFQFTPPRGGRQQICTKISACVCANQRVSADRSAFYRQMNPSFMQTAYHSL